LEGVAIEATDHAKGRPMLGHQVEFLWLLGGVQPERPPLDDLVPGGPRRLDVVGALESDSAAASLNSFAGDLLPALLRRYQDPGAFETIRFGLGIGGGHQEAHGDGQNCIPLHQIPPCRVKDRLSFLCQAEQTLPNAKDQRPADRRVRWIASLGGPPTGPRPPGRATIRRWYRG